MERIIYLCWLYINSINISRRRLAEFVTARLAASSTGLQQSIAGPYLHINIHFFPFFFCENEVNSRSRWWDGPASDIFSLFHFSTGSVSLSIDFQNNAAISKINVISWNQFNWNELPVNRNEMRWKWKSWKSKLEISSHCDCHLMDWLPALPIIKRKCKDLVNNFHQ